MIRRIVALGVAIGTIAVATPAWATPGATVIQGEHVRLVSIIDQELAGGMSPGDPVRWDVEISADAPDPGTLTVGVSATGDTPLTMDAAACASAWQGDVCPGGAAVLRADWDVPRDGSLVVLEESPSDSVVHLRLDVHLATPGAGDATEVRVHALGAGEEIDTGPDVPLPPTGGWSREPLLIAAGTMLAVGLSAFAIARIRQREDRS